MSNELPAISSGAGMALARAPVPDTSLFLPHSHNNYRNETNIYLNKKMYWPCGYGYK